MREREASKRSEVRVGRADNRVAAPIEGFVNGALGWSVGGDHSGTALRGSCRGVVVLGRVWEAPADKVKMSARGDWCLPRQVEGNGLRRTCAEFEGGGGRGE